MKWFLVISLVLNLALGFLLLKGGYSSNQQRIQEKDAEEYPYLSKRIFVENPNDVIINFIPLRNSLNSYIDSLDEFVALYFEYLPSGTSIGINEKEELRLSSLGKVPIAMAAYKLIAEGKIRPEQELMIEQEHIDKQFGDLWKKGVGAKITIEEAIRLSLTDSDNTANNLLLANLPGREVDKVFESFDIPKNKNPEEDFPVISVKNFSSILRSLYLSSYLPEKYSNKVLEILTQTRFTDQIQGGVPKDILVAHKVGVFELKNSIKSVFRDCGIVYVPKGPYILCVMIQSDNTTASKIITEISKIIYMYVSQIKSEFYIP